MREEMNSRHITILLILYFSSVICITVDNFLPYGPEHGDTRAPTNYDGSTPPIPISSLFPFFNHQHNSLIVNTNGVISFLGTMSSFTPSPFPLGSNKRLIAPYWTDIDTRNGGDIWYRESTNRKLLQQMSRAIRLLFPEQYRFQASWLFIATWDNVAFHGANAIGKTKLCRFQCLLLTNGRHSFTAFLYDKIEWTTGTASNGDHSTGLGGTPAQVGYDAGDGTNYYALPESRTPEIINVSSMSNVNISGLFVFRVDSAEIIQGGCNTNGTLTITPKEASMLGGTLLVISGPYFSQTDSVFLVMPDAKGEIHCKWISEYSVSCILPPLYRTGREMVELRVIQRDNKTVTFTGIITVVNHAITKPVISRYPVNWKHESTVVLNWKSDEMNFPLNLKVNVDLYYPKKDGGSGIILMHHSSLPTPNVTGNYSFRLNFPMEAGIIRISVNDPNSPYYWSDMFTVLVNMSTSMQICENWNINDMTIQTMHHENVTSCPCSLDVALLDLTRFHIDPLCVETAVNVYDCYQQPFAKLCFKQNLPSVHGYGNQCCYDGSGLLMNPEALFGSGYANRYHYAGDNLDNIPFLSNFIYDVIPYQHCCVYPVQNANTNVYTGCDVFYARRPPNSCVNYVPPVVARGSGDPHLVTLDGLLYTFNGVGEFIAIANDNFTLQMRLEQYGNSQGSSVTSIAARSYNNADVIEVQTNTIRGIDVLVNGELVDFEASISNTLSVRGAVIESISGDQPSVTVTFERPHVSVKAYAVLNILNLLIMTSSDESGEFLGLYGSNDGIKDNDLISRNGTLINSNASMIDIHNQFGLTWAISENESLFTYPVGRTFSSYQNHSFNPGFVIPENVSQAIRDVCGTNYECTYDYYVTGDENLGRLSAKFSDQFDVITNITAAVVSCGFPYNMYNGVWIADGYVKGSTATLECGSGYYQATIVASCSANGSWVVVNSTCIPYLLTTTSANMTESTPPKPGENMLVITIAVVASVVGVLLAISVITIITLKHRKRKQKHDKLLDEYAISDLPSCAKVFDNNRPTPFGGSSTSYSPTSFPAYENPAYVQSVSKGPDKECNERL